MNFNSPFVALECGLPFQVYLRNEWSVIDLAKRSHVSSKIIYAFEDGRCGLKWCVHATFRKTFLRFSWNESYEFAGPFRTKQDAKKCAKNLRRKHGLSASNESKR